MNVKGLEPYQEKKNLKKLKETLRNNYWSEIRKFGREIREVSRERSSEMSSGLHRELKQCTSKSRQMKVSGGVEKMVIDRYRYRGTNHQIPDQNLDRSTKCQEAIEEAEAFSIDPPGVEKLSRIQTQSRSIHQVLRCWQDCDKKKLRKLDRQLAIKEVSRRCRASF